MKIAGLILAAGKSSRMGAFKPLVTTYGKSLIETLIDTLESAGIQDIYVVVGHNRELLTPVIKKCNCIAIENPEYDSGMLSSITTGVKNLDASIGGCFLMPVDIPLVSAGTICALKTCGARNPDHIIHPTYKGRKGHPPLLPMPLMRTMERKSGEHTFKDILGRYGNQSILIDVDDPFILMDVDTPDDLKALNIART